MRNRVRATLAAEAVQPATTDRSVALVLLGALSFACVQLAGAQPYPRKPVRVIVPFPGGGSIDIVARSISQRWSPLLGQPIVIDNRGGAAGTLGTQLAAQAPPDGYTILYANNGPLSIGPGLYPNLPYDVLKDLTPISQTTSAPFLIFASSALPVSTPQQLIAYAKERPGQLNYASSGIGSGLHLAGELFKSVTGVNIVHVPFKGMGQAAPEIASGRVQLAVSTVPGVLPHVKAGRMKGIVSSGVRKSPALPEVPTCLEAQLRGFCSSAWHAVLAPARTPQPIVGTLHDTLARALGSAELREQLLAQEDADTVASTPQQLAAVLRAELVQWGNIIKAVGIKAE